MDAPTDLGQLVLERKATAPLWGLLWLVAVLPGAGGVMILASDAPNVTLAGTLFALAVILIVAPFLLPGRVLHFHERGVTDRAPLKGVRTLRYEDVEHMTWSALKPSVGVTVTAELLGGGHRINFEARMDTGGRLEQTLAGLRNRIAPYVAARVQRQIEGGQVFAWGSQKGEAVRLQRDGIVHRVVRFVGKGDDQLIPWTTPLNYVIREGGFAVFAAGDKKALFALACGDSDFYAGFLVFTSMGQVQPSR